MTTMTNKLATAAVLALLFGASIFQSVAATSESDEDEQDDQESVKTYSSACDGIRFNYPADWVVDTQYADDPDADYIESRLGGSIIATFCPREDALPRVGGKSSCDGAEDTVDVFRFKNLDERAEFADVGNPTLHDLLAYFIQFMEELPTGSFSDFDIVEQSDTTVNMINAPETKPNNYQHSLSS
jgi:hypothetical protein